MKALHRPLVIANVVLLVSHVSSLAVAQPNNSASKARQILDATGVRGGLIVHIGCGDAKLTAALRVDERYVVHGLDTDAGNVAGARKQADSPGRFSEDSVMPARAANASARDWW